MELIAAFHPKKGLNTTFKPALRVFPFTQFMRHMPNMPAEYTHEYKNQEK
jgi:hypothetical protein